MAHDHIIIFLNNALYKFPRIQILYELNRQIYTKLNLEILYACSPHVQYLVQNISYLIPAQIIIYDLIFVLVVNKS
jgi:hypothetical protein